jgi:D-sedoheptulose 7-phosphate isomerase
MDPKAAVDLLGLQNGASRELRNPAPSGELVAISFLEKLARILELVPGEPLDCAVKLLLDTAVSGRRVYVIGNGGSAATASHLVCDLSKVAQVPGHQPLRTFALTDNVPLLTAWANDTDYSRVFAEQLTALVEPGDVVIAISASGTSPNIVTGLKAAATAGARTIGLFGFNGGSAYRLVDVAIHVRSNDYGLVESAHLGIAHALTAAIRRAWELNRPDVTRTR